MTVKDEAASTTVKELITRSNGLGSDPRNTNYAGGNTSAQGTAVEQDPGAYHAQRALLKREVLPVHVADAVFALTGADLSQTTGVHIAVDSGVAAGFLR
jgi:hypothetical protein